MVKHPERLAKVDPRLVAIIQKVSETRDVFVIEGARTRAAEEEAIRTGHSSLKDPMRSKHVIDPATRPLALAVDLGPVPLVWEDLKGFEWLSVDMKSAANDLQTPIQWGGDWIHFKDYPHYQLAED